MNAKWNLLLKKRGKERQLLAFLNRFIWMRLKLDENKNLLSGGAFIHDDDEGEKYLGLVWNNQGFVFKTHSKSYSSFEEWKNAAPEECDMKELELLKKATILAFQEKNPNLQDPEDVKETFFLIRRFFGYRP